LLCAHAAASSSPLSIPFLFTLLDTDLSSDPDRAVLAADLSSDPGRAVLVADLSSDPGRAVLAAVLSSDPAAFARPPVSAREFSYHTYFLLINSA